MFLVPQAAPEAFLADARRALASGGKEAVAKLFAKPGDARYLFEMVDQRPEFHGGLAKFAVDVFPAPPGWEATGTYWAIFHQRQPVEMDHDPVYPVTVTPDGLRLGPELPEWKEADNRVRVARTDVHLLPAAHRVEVATELDLDGRGADRADVLRLQDTYTLSRLAIDGKARRVVVAGGGVPRPMPGDVLRVGSLIVPWTKARSKRLEAGYAGDLPSGAKTSGSDDLLDERAGYLTAWWVPGTSRLPFTSEVRVTGPKGWNLRSEGVPIPPSAKAVFPAESGEQRLAFRCDVPISFPKVIGGRYEEAARLDEGGRTYRAFQFAPVDRARAAREVRSAADAVRFFEPLLGPFPFPGYDVYDADRFYGIESYSHTILAKNITDWAISHEIGHTYFGGLVPCPYVRDTWNESLTQYVDSILLKRNADRSLQRAFDRMDARVPLTELPVPWSYANASYMRGAFTMTMLAHEIGGDAVNAGMRALVDDRRGKDTAWPDLRGYFERASGKDLLWFWDQWVTGTEWPTLKMGSARSEALGAGYRTRVALAQSGTPKPLRLRFLVRLSGEGKTKDAEVTLDKATDEVTLATDFRPDSAALEVSGYAYVKAAPKVAVAKE